MSELFDDPESVSTKPVMGESFPKFIRLSYGEHIDCKLMTNPTLRDKQGNRLRVYVFSSFWYEVVKDGKVVMGKDGRPLRWSRPSLAVLGEEDPQAVFVKSVREKMKELKKDGKDETPEFAKLKKMEDKFKAANVAVLLIVRPGSAKVEALAVPTTASDGIFGKEAYGAKPAIEGLFGKMKAVGKNIFDLKSDKGWMRIEKTGTQWNNTEYPITETPKTPKKVTLQSGEVVEMYADFSASVSPELFKLEIKDVPDVVKIASEFAWTSDEVREYLKSRGTVLPTRILEKKKSEIAKDETPVETPFAEPKVETKVETKVTPAVNTTVVTKTAEAKTVEVKTETVAFTDEPQVSVDDDDLDSMFDV